METGWWQRGSEGRCECFEGYYGPDCAKKACPVYDGKVCDTLRESLRAQVYNKCAWQECNGQGECVRQKCETNGHCELNQDLLLESRCVCKFPYFGDKCHLKHCQGAELKQLMDSDRALRDMVRAVEQGATRRGGLLAGGTRLYIPA